MKIGIIDLCKQIEDPRMNRKKVHKMETIIYISIAAVICGAQSWNEIEEFGNAKITFFKSRIPDLGSIPSHDTFNRFFSIIKPEYFELIFRNWVKQVCQEVKGVVAIDGKLMRGPSQCDGEHTTGKEGFKWFFVKFGGNLFFISPVFFFLNPIKSCRYVCFLVTLKTPHH